ncbi:PREDICTED: V-type proton ATPase 116 kDa subunit a isoform 1-like isoform X2 [Dinoponera quadriceps]|uniref:V-type proton ATPase subunit a n=1 Tax=Dinoponera quadriceps TaxID=609295 RepID=A0A6P3X1E0_DINQU|nr:PREDICTED: V-type proton ATPase 116 kDa subunit a isoform 1-like isoform X2 [Dinoponera quadriceps]XP_014472184.1 PREDICTED: V-type proton ATPase 116 kDa subunit a isoform 1-like isoform X2 [Dinoponera quadriceps]XP_014472185.1 PREDICTED: V-type proton ATPase 116 kDa subunit a isoform 1-like isoform X2 [Dinoponera quadriceps]XP_014472186.1 PREDICTED: V-type proton ATPase 116 kDa subunit a isoform 1-like isoform X2 [Dinoponera quadriceps]XP_014472187.1 PREDICTED: V-type proton ATPase 116 kDa 
MGAMFRSEDMALCQLFIQPEAAYLSVSELGETGTVQFRDLNGDVNYFQRKFVNEVRRCDELERKLRYIETEVRKDDVPIADNLTELPRAPNPREIINLEAHVEKTENDIRELSQNAVNLKINYVELTELQHVLEKTRAFFTEEEANDSISRALINEEPQNPVSTTRGRLEFVGGVINRERVPAFERMLWRISRGNVFLRQSELEKPLEDPATGNQIYKTVFVAFFQGEQLKSRIKKVCAGFHASLYPCPTSLAEREEMVKGVRTRLEDLNLVLNQTQDHRQRVLHNVAKELPNWSIMVRKMKAIYHTMNLFNMDVSKKCLIGECWVPVSDLTTVQNCLTEGSRLCGSSIPSFLNVIHTDENPPTFNRTNKFTRGFQNLIDAYGVASYREANPALYTIVTFPFLFGVMFGDAGHGLILTIFAAAMIIREKKIIAQKSSNEIASIFFGGRYIILLMGLFSIYAGLIYNDVFSKSLNIFGSSWRISYNESTVNENPLLQLHPGNDYIRHPYPLGLDPVWALARNKIVFQNSFKMKLSIIFGVVHMIFGVCINVVNIVNFRRYHSFFLEFLPQLFFLIVLFFYMTVLMFIKWILYNSNDDKSMRSSMCAPSVLITFINMMLFKHANMPPECSEYMFEGQNILQFVCLGIAVACIPVMLFGKPLYVLCTRAKRVRNKGKTFSNGNASQEIEMQVAGTSKDTAGGGHGNHDDMSFGELMITQAIHTIEYALSTVSHTASYLRLWALSLAHSQLSEVLWGRLLRLGMGATEGDYVTGALLSIFFAVWAFFTIAILVMMEGLSAFLHTLRLHWVEFMTKFYEGTGYPFQPFYFKSILDAEDAEE